MAHFNLLNQLLGARLAKDFPNASLMPIKRQAFKAFFAQSNT
jgi:hypothetical protein